MAKIFVVDDEKNVADLVAFVLTRDGHSVKTANDGQAGFNAVLIEKPELLILDVMLPGMDGYTICSKLAEEDETRNLPIIMLTAKGQMRDVFSMSSNVVAYVEKPFEPSELCAKVKKALADRAR